MKWVLITKKVPKPKLKEEVKDINYLSQDARPQEYMDLDSQGRFLILFLALVPAMEAEKNLHKTLITPYTTSLDQQRSQFFKKW